MRLRVEKLQELIKQEVGKMLLREIKDPRIGFVTVTDVEMTGDLREAKIFVSLMGSDEQVKSSWEGLQSALGFIRREIGHRIRLRFTPFVSFAVDKSLDYGEHIQKLLLQIEKDARLRAESGVREEGVRVTSSTPAAPRPPSHAGDSTVEKNKNTETKNEASIVERNKKAAEFSETDGSSRAEKSKVGSTGGVGEEGVR